VKDDERSRITYRQCGLSYGYHTICTDKTGVQDGKTFRINEQACKRNRSTKKLILTNIPFFKKGDITC